MKKILLLVMVVMGLTACHENLGERAAREAQEFTKKSCPMEIAEGIIIDSMTFDKTAETVYYYYTLSGVLDTTLTEEMKKQTKEQMLDGLRNTPTLKGYKDAGFGFHYIFRSQKDKKKVLLDYNFTKKDY